MSGGSPGGDGSGGSMVTLHIYDLTRGVMKRHRDVVFGEEVHGMWHTGVSVFGREYFFEGGITSVPSGKSRFGRPKAPHGRRHVIGNTDFDKTQFEKWVRSREKSTYGKLCYHLVEKNCNHFTNDAVQFLTGKSIPEEILRLPRLVTSSAIGRLFSPHVDRFFGGWQWMILKQHWSHRKRLDRQWAHFLKFADSQAAPPSPLSNTSVTHRHRRYLACASASKDSATQHFVELSEAARERKLRIAGRPPPRVFVFGPGDEADVSRLVERLRTKAFAWLPQAERETHAAGLEGIAKRLEELRESAPTAAYRNVDACNHGSAEVAEPRLPEAEVLCLSAMLAPLNSLWRLLVALSQNVKVRQPVTGDGSSDSSSSDSVESATARLAQHEGAGKYYARAISRNTKAIVEEFARRKDGALAVMDAVSRLCLAAPMAKLIMGGHVEPCHAASLFDEKEEPAADQQLRQMITGKNGLLGDYSRDFDHLPVPLQVMVLRCFANVYAAHPSLGRLVALSMASSSENRLLESLGLQTRNALHNKEHPILRLTAASLLTNAVCYLNKEVASGASRHKPKERPPVGSAARVSSVGGGGGSVSSTAAVRGPRSPSLPCSPIVRTTGGGAVGGGGGGGGSSASTADVSVSVAVTPDDAERTGLPSSPAPPSDGSSPSESRTGSTEDSGFPTAPDTVPMPSIEKSPEAHHHRRGMKAEASNVTKLRSLIVRALSRRMQVERDMTVQQRLLTALYHACLPSEAARTQLASVPLSFANAKRMPDMESRYLARMVDFMSKSVSAPPPEVCVPGPVIPQKWHDLPTSSNRKNVPF